MWMTFIWREENICNYKVEYLNCIYESLYVNKYLNSPFSRVIAASNVYL